MLNKDIAKVIGEITEVSLLINLNTKDTVFVNVSGHVDQIEIKYHKGGWISGKDADIESCIYYFSDSEDSELKLKSDKRTLKKLKKIRDSLRKIYKNGCLSKDSLNIEEVVTVEEVKHFV